MKKNLVTFAVVLAVVLMVLPATPSVNNTSVKLTVLASAFQSDGNPIPPMPPHRASTSSLVASDGNPIPPMPPHAVASQITF